MTTLIELYRVDNYIDTFALGHYARVLDALDRRSGHTTAFKVMRPEHLSPDGEIRWEYRAFGNEADLLMKLGGSPYMVDLLDCGYISSPSEAPADGDIVSFQRDVLGFIQAIPQYNEQGWRPYLALQNLPRIFNLLYLMKPSHQDVRWRLPSEEGLALALQFSELLRLAHQQGIVYLDHKLEHVYWDGTQLRIIDLNSSRQLEGGAGDGYYYRMDIHNLCVGILYPVFTGLSAKNQLLRPQPGTVQDVEARYVDVNELEFGAEPSLSVALCTLLQKGAAMQIETIDAFISELHQVAAQHGWDFPHHYTSPASRDARAQMRAGINRLREGQTSLREARDLFREALIQDGISPDLEDELRRLVKALNKMLNERVIP